MAMVEISFIDTLQTASCFQLELPSLFDSTPSLIIILFQSKAVMPHMK